MTDSELKLWSKLRGNQLGYYFKRQTPIGHYIVDFVCRKEKLVVEVDGCQHYSVKGLEYDRRRDKFLGEQGFRVLRFTNSETLENTQGVLDEILENLKRMQEHTASSHDAKDNYLRESIRPTSSSE